MPYIWKTKLLSTWQYSRYTFDFQKEKKNMNHYNGNLLSKDCTEADFICFKDEIFQSIINQTQSFLNT